MTTTTKPVEVATLSFTAQQTDLQVLEHLARITNKNKMFPNIANIKLEATSKDMLTCSATDRDISMVAKIKCIECAGAACIEGRKFYDLISKAEGVINFDNGVIKFGRNKFKLPVTDIKNFGIINSIDGDVSTIETIEFIKQLKRTTFATSQIQQDILSGVYIDKSKLVATDGNMLVVNNLPKEAITTPIIITHQLADEIVKCFDDTEKLDIITNNVKIMIKSGDMVLISTLLNGKYPNYAQLIPSEKSHIIALDKQQILEALDLLSIVKNVHTNICILEFSENILKITANNADNGEGSIDIDVDYTDESFKIAFNIDYLKGILKNVCEDSFTIGLDDPMRAAIIKNGNDIALIMPMLVR